MESLETLFDEIGVKIKGWARTIFYIEAVLCILSGIVCILAGGGFFAGLVILILGPLSAWLSTWLLYGFGELIDMTCRNEAHAREIIALLKQNLENSEKKEPAKTEKASPKAAPALAGEQSAPTKPAEVSSANAPKAVEQKMEEESMKLQKAERMIARGSLGDCQDAIALLDKMSGSQEAEQLRKKALEIIAKCQNQERERSAVARRADQWQSEGRCRHCGGEFTGFINKACVVCGREKDY